MKPVDGEKRSPSLEEGQPPPKRKKTVTWAGDVPTSSAEQEGPTQLAQEPAVVVLQQQESDFLFAGLDESLLEQQVDTPPTATAALSREALLQHRIDDIDRLYQLYQEEAYSLYEELHLRHHRFTEQQQQPQGQSETTAPLAEQEEPAVKEQQQQEQQAGAALDVRQLVRSLAERQQPAGQPAERLEQGKQAVQSGAAEQQQQQQQTPPAQGEAGAAAGEATPKDGQQQQQAAAAGQAAGAQSAQPSQPQEQQAAGGGQAAAEPQAAAEAGAGKETERQADLPQFEDVEATLLSLGPGTAPVPPERLLAQRASFVKHLGLIGRLEQSCLGALCRELDAFGAVAALCSRSRRYLLRRTAVMLGRSTESQGKVDVDLSCEGHSQTVSRQQAQLVLEADGTFWLRCLGRRAVFVNGQRLEQGGAAPLPHLSLVKLGGVGLLFVANHGAVRRAVRRSAAMVV